MSTILAIDDDPTCRELLRRLLPRMGHTVVVASNGRDALEALKTQVPDLILLDLAMPQMDGLTFLRILREDPKFTDVPAIMITALANRDTVRIARSLGVRDYLVKSEFTTQALCERIQKYLTAAQISSTSPAAPDSPAPSTASVAAPAD